MTPGNPFFSMTSGNPFFDAYGDTSLELCCPRCGYSGYYVEESDPLPGLGQKVRCGECGRAYEIAVRNFRPIEDA